MLVEAFLLAAAGDLPDDVRLVLAGEGPERSAIEHRCRAHPQGDRVCCSAMSHLLRCETATPRRSCSVSPCYVVLSIVQSLSFGVPMIYMRDEQHCPEIEAAVDGFNSQSLTPATPAALANVLVGFAHERAAWSERRVSIAEDCARRYSADLMADRILEAAR